VVTGVTEIFKMAWPSKPSGTIRQKKHGVTFQKFSITDYIVSNNKAINGW
jgi:hypothetical protein